MMLSKSKQATKTERARMDAIKEQGCVIARFLGIGWLPCEVHHITLGGKHGGKRLGHMHTVGLNSWSHRGVPLDGWTAAACRERLGPSLAREPRAFRELWPDDRLLELQDRMLSCELGVFRC